jgi:hypothetical protein
VVTSVKQSPDLKGHVFKNLRNSHTVKPVLRGHLQDKEKVVSPSGQRKSGSIKQVPS